MLSWFQTDDETTDIVSKSLQRMSLRVSISCPLYLPSIPFSARLNISFFLSFPRNTKFWQTQIR